MIHTCTYTCRCSAHHKKTVREQWEERKKHLQNYFTKQQSLLSPMCTCVHVQCDSVNVNYHPPLSPPSPLLPLPSLLPFPSPLPPPFSLPPLPSLLTSNPASSLLSLTGLIRRYQEVRVIAVETWMGLWTHMCTRTNALYSIAPSRCG